MAQQWCLFIIAVIILLIPTIHILLVDREALEMRPEAPAAPFQVDKRVQVGQMVLREMLET